jgi:hypothetical protein
MTGPDNTTLAIQKINADIGRWQTRLVRAVNAIRKLDGKRKRLVARSMKPKAQAPKAEPVALPVADNSLDIPGFLRRDPDGGKSLAATLDVDAVAAAMIRDDQADRAKRKKIGSEARRKAQRSGETKKMPLTGKEALAAIRA